MNPPFNPKKVAADAIKSGLLEAAEPAPKLVGQFKSTPGPRDGVPYRSPYRTPQKRYPRADVLAMIEADIMVAFGSSKNNAVKGAAKEMVKIVRSYLILKGGKGA